MTLDDFRKLKTGDKVVVYNKIYVVSVGFNIYSVPFIEFLMNDRSVYRIYNKECSGIFSVYENNNNFVEQIPHGKFKFVNDMEIYDEKKYLEIQLKEEQRRIETEILSSNNKQAEIQKKLIELTLPQIGKIYEITCNQNEHSWYGVITKHLKYKVEIVSYDKIRKIVTERFFNESFCNGDYSFVEVPEKNNIAKSILEFIELGDNV